MIIIAFCCNNNKKLNKKTGQWSDSY